MRMFLLGCIALCILVIITAALKVKNSDNQATRKRRRDKRKSNNPLGDNPFDMPSSEDLVEINSTDVDEALGLKPQQAEFQQSEAFHEQQTVSENAEPLSSLKYVVLHVMASDDQPFAGYELLQALLSGGLRYGKHKIFYRHLHKNGQGEVQFSLAAANKPGTFDLPNMGNFSCPGLTLFTVLQEVQDPKHAFELMLAAANQLAEDLGGEVWGENRKVLTVEDISQLRAQLAAYAEQTRNKDLFVDS